MSKTEIGFEEKLENAKKTLEKLMSPDITLEKSVLAYEEGMRELHEASKLLQEAEIKIQEIKAT